LTHERIDRREPGFASMLRISWSWQRWMTGWSNTGVTLDHAQRVLGAVDADPERHHAQVPGEVHTIDHHTSQFPCHSFAAIVQAVVETSTQLPLGATS